MKDPVLDTAYGLIQGFYGDQAAERSGVPLINHIDEGLRILRHMCLGTWVQAAFCLHPLVQADAGLAQHWQKLMAMPGYVSIMAMEYRNIANACLSDKVQERPGGLFMEPPQLSPLQEVNHMLIADKVQNRTDFELYHKGSHPRSAELDLYFKVWLSTLGVDEQTYKTLAAVAKSKGALP